MTPASFRVKYNIDSSIQIFGPFGGKLADGGESIKLLRPEPTTSTKVPYTRVDFVDYLPIAPWPTGIILILSPF